MMAAVSHTSPAGRRVIAPRTLRNPNPNSLRLELFRFQMQEAGGAAGAPAYRTSGSLIA